jgi:hypothetical protein
MFIQAALLKTETYLNRYIHTEEYLEKEDMNYTYNNYITRDVFFTNPHT